MADDPVARLVILGPESPHAARQADTPARQAAADMLARRGTANRDYPNALAFLAPDRTRLPELEQAVRQFLAWRSIAEESEGDTPALELDAFQKRQVKTKLEQSDDTVTKCIPETFHWLLVPYQSATRDDGGPLPPRTLGRWSGRRSGCKGQDGLTVRASKKMKNDDLLIGVFGPTLLRADDGQGAAVARRPRGRQTTGGRLRQIPLPAPPARCRSAARLGPERGQLAGLAERDVRLR